MASVVTVQPWGPAMMGKPCAFSGVCHTFLKEDESVL